MAFKIIDPGIEQRLPFMLIREPIAAPGAEGVDGKVPMFTPYDQVAPGLYPDEHIAELDSGEWIAISVSTSRMKSGGGMEFLGWARVINEDGSTKIDKSGEEMELQCNHPVTAAALQILETDEETAQARVTREIMLMMLGEPPTLRPIHVDPEAPVTEVAVDLADWERNPKKAPPGTVLVPDATEAPVIGWSPDVRLNHSIRHAIQLADRAEPEVDVGALMSA